MELGEKSSKRRILNKLYGAGGEKEKEKSFLSSRKEKIVKMCSEN
jgi:hypothetical protein